MKNFALIGASGYIAPRHLKAIKDNGCNLVAALDLYDGVGIMDSYFPDAAFFVEPERFDRHIEKNRIEKNLKLDYVSICTPNFLHDSHIRMGLRWGADVICEKPLVLNPWNIDALNNIQYESKRKIWNVLQLRYHPAIISLRQMVEKSPPNKVFDIELTYLTSRGQWYYTSWKGNKNKSGGIATNIGIHFFDMLSWIFGDVLENTVHINSHDRSSGFILFKKARVKWFLSINYDLIPDNLKKIGKRTFRSFKIEDNEIEFSDGFTDLHTEVYRQILKGNGFTVDDAKKSVEIVHEIRNSKPIGVQGNYHYLAKKPISIHPFLK